MQDKGARVRSKILQTIQRGIVESSAREGELTEGEQQMLEHMRLYVDKASLLDGADGVQAYVNDVGRR